MGWAEATVEQHLNRILERFKGGIHISAEVYNSPGPRHTVNGPGIVPDPFFAQTPPPQPEDKYVFLLP